jgi:hypothetical protein
MSRHNLPCLKAFPEDIDPEINLYDLKSYWKIDE